MNVLNCTTTLFIVTTIRQIILKKENSGPCFINYLLLVFNYGLMNQNSKRRYFDYESKFQYTKLELNYNYMKLNYNSILNSLFGKNDIISNSYGSELYIACACVVCMRKCV